VLAGSSQRRITGSSGEATCAAKNCARVRVSRTRRKRELRSARQASERLVEFVASAATPSEFGIFRASAYRSVIDGTEHLALVIADLLTTSLSDVDALCGSTLSA
jgi:hypothetical protein